jgi:hypothetical protein
MTDTSSTPPPQPGRRRRYRRRGSTSRHIRLTTRFNDDEMGLVQEAAAAADLTLAGFCGLAALTAARRINATDRDGEPDGGPTDDELAEMQRELYAARVAVNRAGTNLNQAVAELNATGKPPVWLKHAVARAMAAVEQVDAVASRIHRRLG